MKRVRGFRLTEEVELKLEALRQYYDTTNSALVERLVEKQYREDRYKIEEVVRKEKDDTFFRTILNLVIRSPKKGGPHAH